MAGTRKRYTAEFKAQLALEVIKGEKTANEIASQHSVHPTMLTQWKKQLLENAPDLFVDKRSKEAIQDEQIVDQLYQQIGQLQMELTWLKKKLGRLS